MWTIIHVIKHRVPINIRIQYTIHTGCLIVIFSAVQTITEIVLTRKNVFYCTPKYVIFFYLFELDTHTYIVLHTLQIYLYSVQAFCSFIITCYLFLTKQKFTISTTEKLNKNVQLVL